VLRDTVQSGAEDGSREVRDAAMQGLWALHREFAEPAQLEAAIALAKQDPERGFEALNRYVHTHPCAWDAQVHLASVALTRQRFDLTTKYLASVRWLFPDDANQHFVYGQALASSGKLETAITVFEYAAKLAPDDPDIQRWITFSKEKLVTEQESGLRTLSVKVAHHVARSLLVLVGMIRSGRVHPSSLVLHKLPGDVSLVVAIQAVAQQEQRRFGENDSQITSVELDLRGVSERTALLDYAGEPVSPDSTVGDLSDPGVIIALAYETMRRDAAGLPVDPTREEGRRMLLEVVSQDHELATKLARHLDSPDATLKARLDLEA
jgi:tetratricopeptide (TPR) repeat protein